jgi:hypothetical protein
MFIIELKYKNQLHTANLKPICSGDVEYECVEELVINVCDRLEHEDIMTFAVKGFELDWPVDIETDLAIVIPQLPPAIAALKKAGPFTIQFCGQGIEKVLQFSSHGDDIHIHCKALIGNTTSPVVEIVSKIHIEDSLTQMFVDFIELGNQYYPDLALSELIKQEFS